LWQPKEIKADQGKAGREDHNKINKQRRSRDPFCWKKKKMTSEVGFVELFRKKKKRKGEEKKEKKVTWRQIRRQKLHGRRGQAGGTPEKFQT